jgi:hypothetical protein
MLTIIVVIIVGSALLPFIILGIGAICTVFLVGFGWFLQDMKEGTIELIALVKSWRS